MIFNLNHQHFVSSLSYAKHKYFRVFHWYSNSIAVLLMLVSLINEACMKIKRAKILEDLAQ